MRKTIPIVLKKSKFYTFVKISDYTRNSVLLLHKVCSEMEFNKMAFKYYISFSTGMNSFLEKLYFHLNAISVLNPSPVHYH